MVGVEGDSEVALALEWFAGIGGASLEARLHRAVAYFTEHRLPELGSIMWPDSCELIPPDDQIAGFLLQGHALLRDRSYFDSILSSRAIPFLKLIGSALPELSHVDGARERAIRLLDVANDHPEGTLLELTIA